MRAAVPPRRLREKHANVNYCSWENRVWATCASERNLLKFGISEVGEWRFPSCSLLLLTGDVMCMDSAAAT